MRTISIRITKQIKHFNKMTWERDFLTLRAARRCMIFLLPMGKILFALFPFDMEIYLSIAISGDIFGVLGGCLAKFTDLLEETIE